MVLVSLLVFQEHPVSPCDDGCDGPPGRVVGVQALPQRHGPHRRGRKRQDRGRRARAPAENREVDRAHQHQRKRRPVHRHRVRQARDQHVADEQRPGKDVPM